MDEFQGLRAQDFQKAWPQAYSQAIHHVVTLQEQAGHQMASATRQIFLAQRTSEKASSELLAAKEGIVEAIEAASDYHLTSIREISAYLKAKTADVVAREQAFLRRVLIEKNTLDQSRAKLAQEAGAIQTSSMWRRLWWALHPASFPCVCSIETSESTGPQNENN